MSGFEIAGVVLGSIPLLISGLEHYNDGLVPIKDMIRYEYVVKGLVRALNVARCRLRNTCEKLLIGLVKDEELAVLLDSNSLGGENWKRPDLEHKLRERLAESYDGYMATIAHLAGLIFRFAKMMGLDSKLRPTWVEKTGTSYTRNILYGTDLKRKSAKLWKRVKLGLDHKEFQELIKEMAHENLQLELLTSGNLELEPIRRERSRDMDAKYWNGVRDFAIRLYSCLVSRWPCPCGSQHQASLRLDSRSITSKSDPTDITLGVVFAFENKPNIQRRPWTWRNTEFRGVKTSQKDQLVLPVRSAAIRRVSFDASPPPPSTRTDQSNAQISKPIVIKNLCSALAQNGTKAFCLGYLDDDQWQHYIYYSSPSPDACSELTSNSLHQILSRKSIAQPVAITPRDRYELAALLASTLLQLHDTPWLNDNWTRDDIYLLQGRSEQSLAKNIYVSRSFPSSQKPQVEDDPDLPLLRNVSVFNLGLALLELTFGHPIEFYETDDDLRNGVRTVMTSRLTAERLIGKIEMYEGKRYSDVVYRCIHCDFGSRATSFENDEFRHNFHAGVVVPLEGILHDFMK